MKIIGNVKHFLCRKKWKVKTDRSWLLQYRKDFFIIVLCIVFISGIFFSDIAQCTEKPQPTKTFQHGKNPDIQQIKPKKPVKIKLKRSAKGEYSWDLAGDSVDDIIKADKRLRKMLELE